MEDQQIGWIASIIIGGIAGWLAERFMKSQMGLIMNIVLGSSRHPSSSSRRKKAASQPRDHAVSAAPTSTTTRRITPAVHVPQAAAPLRCRAA